MYLVMYLFIYMSIDLCINKLKDYMINLSIHLFTIWKVETEEEGGRQEKGAITREKERRKGEREGKNDYDGGERERRG